MANQTGNYGISVSTLNRPCSNKSLTCGSASQGKLASPLTFDSYKASLSGGATISIRTASTDAGSSLVPVVEVYDPTGNPVPSAQSVATATFKTSVPGDYTVLVESSNYLQTGGYAIAFARLDVPCNAGGAPPQALSCASVVDGSISGALQANSYSVAAQANDAFLLRLEQTSPNSAFRPRVDVYDPQGNPIQFVNTNSLATPSPSPFPRTAPIPCRCRTAAPAAAKPAHIRFRCVRLNRPCNAGTIGCGALAAGNFSRPLASSVYTYTAAAGESFTLRMLDYTGALQPDLEVYDPQGNPVGQSTSGNVTGVDVAQPAAGVYTVVAMDASAPPGRRTFRYRAAAHQERLLGGLAAGTDGERRRQRRGAIHLVQHSGQQRGRAVGAQRLRHAGLRRPDGPLRPHRRPPRFQHLRALAHGLRNRHLHRRGGRFRPAHGRRLRAFLAVAQQARRHIGLAVWRLHHRIAVRHKRIPLLPRRRQCGRSACG